jgi:phenylacetic acid degradation operon negative regulatory protein
LKQETKPPQNLTARTLLLDLLRTSEPNAWPVRTLIKVADIFGISENSLRVNITRLLAKQHIVQDDRGHYRMGEHNRILLDWVDSWEQGETRTKTWRGDWLTLAISPACKSAQLKNLEKSCFRLGFRELWKNQWLRPNNLTKSQAQIRKQIHSLSECDSFLLTRSSQLMLPERFLDLHSLWDANKLEANYQHFINVLADSAQRADNYDREELLRETFILGGEVINFLAMDPLLPKEMVDIALRDQLTQHMKKYDETYRCFWQKTFLGNPLNSVPIHIEPHLQ